MHYIRLLRPPNVVKASRPGKGGSSLGLVLTITTDLGESFLCPDAPISIAVELQVETVDKQEVKEDGEDEETEEDETGADMEVETTETVTTHVFELYVAGPTSAPAGKANKQNKLSKAAGGDASSWRAGMRVLKFEARLPKEAESCIWDATGSTLKRRICIRTADKTLSARRAQQFVGTTTESSNDGGGGGGVIMPLWVDVPATADEAFSHVALRQLSINYDVDITDNSTACIEVEEEIGESIARHVWDAGLVSVAFLADLCLRQQTSRKRPREEDSDGKFDAKSLPDALRSILLHRSKQEKNLRVLELGSGVGILGIGLAAIVQEADRLDHGGGSSTFLLTDLPEAEERALSNIARSGLSLGYENLDWEDGREGRFGPAVGSHPWDLVVLSDCTYNVDMLPALVETLSALPSPAGIPKPGVFLARKRRHASEEALFALMTDHGWTVCASSTVLLPALDGDAEVVEMYLYEKT